MASDYSGKIVKVANTWLPAPSTYKMTSTTVVDSARDTKGVVTATVIRSGIRKIEMTWKILTQAQFTLIASLFEGDDKFVNSVYYFDTITGTMQTKSMYVGDRVSDTAELVANFNGSGQITSFNGYANVKLSLIEV